MLLKLKGKVRWAILFYPVSNQAFIFKNAIYGSRMISWFHYY